MDSLVIATGIGSFFLFFLIQIVIFKFIDSRGIIKWLLSVFCISGIVDVVVLYLYTSGDDSGVWVITMMSLLIYSALAYIYVTAIFGITITSVRIHILNLVAHAGKKGVTYNQLIQQYNRDSIISTRLERLVASGELKLTKQSTYTLAKKFSPFLVSTYFQVILGKIFARPKVSKYS